MPCSSSAILVIGATGNVGAEVVRALAARGLPVRAASRRAQSATDLFDPAVVPVELDLGRPETFAPALAGIHGLFMLRPPAIADTRSTLNALIDHAVAAGVRHVVFLSVQGADRQHYLPHHAVEEHLQRQTALQVTVLRPGFFAQNLGDAYRLDVRERDTLYVPAGQGRVAWIDCRDIAQVVALSIQDPARSAGQAWTLTGGTTASFAEVASALSDALQRPIRYVAASIPGYMLHLRRQRLPWPQVAVQTLLHVGLRLGNGARIDPTLERLLGHPPRTIVDYIRDHTHLWPRDVEAASPVVPAVGAG